MRKKSNRLFFLEEKKCLGVRSFKVEVKMLRGSCATKPEQTAQLFQTRNVQYSMCNLQHEKVYHKQMMGKHRYRMVWKKPLWISASYKMAAAYLSDSRHGSQWNESFEWPIKSLKQPPIQRPLLHKLLTTHTLTQHETSLTGTLESHNTQQQQQKYEKIWNKWANTLRILHEIPNSH